MKADHIDCNIATRVIRPRDGACAVFFLWYIHDACPFPSISETAAACTCDEVQSRHWFCAAVAIMLTACVPCCRLFQRLCLSMAHPLTECVQETWPPNAGATRRTNDSGTCTTTTMLQNVRLQTSCRRRSLFRSLDGRVGPRLNRCCLGPIRRTVSSTVALLHSGAPSCARSWTASKHLALICSVVRAHNRDHIKHVPEFPWSNGASWPL